jgi:hypothetical protein
MAYELRLETITLPSAADLSTKQYHFVYTDSAGRAALQTSAGANCDGVLQNKPAAIDRAAGIATGGISKVSCSEAIAAGAKVAVHTTGQAKTAVSGNRVLGVAVEAATAANDIIPVLLKLEGEPNA